MKRLIVLVLLVLVGCRGVDSIKTPSEVNVAFVGSRAYGIIIYPQQRLVYMGDVNKVEWEVISPEYGSMYVGGDIVGDRYYVISYTFNDLREVNLITGAVRIIGPIALYNGGGWTGMAEDYLSSANGTQSYLYKVDLNTAQTSLIGEICNDCSVIDIAITQNNVMYALDIHKDVLMSVNPVTGQGKDIGPIGFNASYAQDMDYDDAHHLLYLAAYNKDLMQGELRLADVNTGKTTLVGVFPNGDEVDAFSFVPLKTTFNHAYLPVICKSCVLTQEQ